jgi:hypothetical protein
MKTIYIDSDFKCHTSADDVLTAVETSFFDGKCNTFIEGYRFVPAGKSWTREDGQVFHGEMITPWKNYRELIAAQRQYEQDLADRAELEAAYNYLLHGGTA